VSGYDPRVGLFAQQVVLEHFDRQGHFGQDQRIRCCLIDIRHVPIKNGPVFFDEASDVAGDFASLRFDFELLNLAQSLTFQKS
jgi:hypothetical protein